jgi:hypothetical protein
MRAHHVNTDLGLRNYCDAFSPEISYPYAHRMVYFGGGILIGRSKSLAWLRAVSPATVHGPAPRLLPKCNGGC